MGRPWVARALAMGSPWVAHDKPLKGAKPTGKTQQCASRMAGYPDIQILLQRISELQIT